MYDIEIEEKSLLELISGSNTSIFAYEDLISELASRPADEKPDGMNGEFEDFEILRDLYRDCTIACFSFVDLMFNGCTNFVKIKQTIDWGKFNYKEYDDVKGRLKSAVETYKNEQHSTND